MLNVFWINIFNSIHEMFLILHQGKLIYSKSIILRALGGDLCIRLITWMAFYKMADVGLSLELFLSHSKPNPGCHATRLKIKRQTAITQPLRGRRRCYVNAPWWIRKQCEHQHAQISRAKIKHTGSSSLMPSHAEGCCEQTCQVHDIRWLIELTKIEIRFL